MGLRLKFNLMILPLVVVVLACIVWADYEHEIVAIMDSHAMHSGPVGTVLAGPVTPTTLPDAVARWSLRIHVIYGLVLVGLVMGAVNLALHVFIFRPLRHMRSRVERLERGRWHDLFGPAASDEIGLVATSLDRLGLEISAVVGQAAHADRLATAALMSRHLSGRLVPQICELVVLANRLNSRDEEFARDAGRNVAQCAVSMSAVVQGLDRLFPAAPSIEPPFTAARAGPSSDQSQPAGS